MYDDRKFFVNMMIKVDKIIGFMREMLIVEDVILFDDKNLNEVQEELFPSAGTCMVMGTACTMASKSC